MITDLINKKKENGILSEQEINYVVDSYLNDTINDDQMASFLRAICDKGMNDDEVEYLTRAYINSGEQIDLSQFGEELVDKHSTGGVGDKITLIVLPLVASCGIKVAKMSGRGLGYTGGTIDKLESIKGFNVNLSLDELKRELTDIGCAITTTNTNLVPADKKIYALRDVTGTVSSIPLIAASIMSKKIAMGAKKIVLDVKMGRGAFVNNLEEAELLSKTMITIGFKFGVQVRTIITNMDYPLGNAVGNGLEVLEAIEILQSQGNEMLRELAITVASHMVSMGKNIPVEVAKVMVLEALVMGQAYQKLIELVAYQGGNIDDIEIEKEQHYVLADRSGYINDIDAKVIADIVKNLGAGRKTKEDLINYGVGIVINKNVGSYVNRGEVIATIYGKPNEKVLEAFTIEAARTKDKPLIYKILN